MSGNLAYQEEIRDEMLNGKIVLMSPRPTVNHNRIALNIANIFTTYLKGKTCEAFGDGVDLYLTENDRFVPDGMIVCDKDKIKPDGIHGAPNLIIEVLSPSTANNDRGYKKDTYEKYGVGEYWIVTPNDKTLEIYLLNDGKYTFNGAFALYPDFMLEKMTDEEKAKISTEFKCNLFPDLTISLEDVFSRVF